MTAVRILYLEDNPDDVALARHMLAHHQQESEWTIARDGAELTAALAHGGFDLILLDNQVPGLDGAAAWQACQAAWPDTPVALLSGGYVTARTAAANILAGAADQFDKTDLWRLVPLVQRARERREHARLARQAQAWEQVADVAQALSTARSLEQIQEIVRHAARRLTGADGATLVLRDGEQCYYVDEDAIGPLWKGLRFPLTACISGWAMLNQQAALIEDIYADERVPVEAYRPTFVKSLAMVPIRVSAPVGAIGNYWATPHRATPDEVRLLQTLAATTAVAIENAQLYQAQGWQVRERTAQLQAATQELETYAYNISQELRAPLRVIDGFSQVLLEESGESLNATAQDAARRIQAAAQRAKTMVERWLRLAGIDQAELRPVAVDLSRLAREAAVECQAAQPTRTVDLVVTADLQARGDRGLLRLLLQCLLDNAWKYTASQSAARVEFGRATLPDGSQAYVVRDNGVGFSQEQGERLFGPFRPVTAPGEGLGAGVGLALAQRIVQRHGGRIWAEATPGEGARFYFTLGG